MTRREKEERAFQQQIREKEEEIKRVEARLAEFRKKHRVEDEAKREREGTTRS